MISVIPKDPPGTTEVQNHSFQTSIEACIVNTERDKEFQKEFTRTRRKQRRYDR